MRARVPARAASLHHGLARASLPRSLYRRVHPDLFHRQPAAHAVNLASMQELQSFLDAGPRSRASEPVKLRFFVAGADAAAPAREVSLTWRPPGAVGDERWARSGDACVRALLREVDPEAAAADGAAAGAEAAAPSEPAPAAGARPLPSARLRDDLVFCASDVPADRRAAARCARLLPGALPAGARRTRRFCCTRRPSRRPRVPAAALRAWRSTLTKRRSQTRWRARARRRRVGGGRRGGGDAVGGGARARARLRARRARPRARRARAAGAARAAARRQPAARRPRRAVARARAVVRAAGDRDAPADAADADADDARRRAGAGGRARAGGAVVLSAEGAAGAAGWVRREWRALRCAQERFALAAELRDRLRLGGVDAHGLGAGDGAGAGGAQAIRCATRCDRCASSRCGCPRRLRRCECGCGLAAPTAAAAAAAAEAVAHAGGAERAHLLARLERASKSLPRRRRVKLYD